MFLLCPSHPKLRRLFKRTIRFHAEMLNYFLNKFVNERSYSKAKKEAINSATVGSHTKFQANAKRHICFSLHEPGLVVSPAVPRLGASPDGLRKCSCCKEAVVEFKCPYSGKDLLFFKIVLGKNKLNLELKNLSQTLYIYTLKCKSRWQYVVYRNVKSKRSMKFSVDLPQPAYAFVSDMLVFHSIPTNSS